MRAVKRTPDEQYELIMECRTSGLSDYQWCTDHGINPGTFYNWVKRLRKKACYDIPPAAMYAHCTLPEKQEVVRLEILPEQPAEVTGQKELFSCRAANSNSQRLRSRVKIKYPFVRHVSESVL